MSERPIPLDDLADMAEQNARNLWSGADLEQIAPEQWQRVLVNVEAKARMRGHVLPDDWRSALTRHVGRSDG